MHKSIGSMLATACVIALAGCTYHTSPVRPAPVNHPVFITLKDPADTEALIADCDRYLTTIPGVIAYYCGTPLDTGRDTVDANYHVGLYVGFESVEAYETYVTHPNHVRLVNDWKPRIDVLFVRDVLDAGH